jgi:undecaprenyl diphosphate synthase
MGSDATSIPGGTGAGTRADPRHVAIVMDGNGRWARRRFLPRVAGHRRGVEAVREIVKACRERRIEFLTLFAFSSENWQRPADEVSYLMELFALALEDEVAKLHQHGIRFRVIGDLSRFGPRICDLIARAESLTRDNAGLVLTVAANYGGRWDMLQAVNRMLTARSALPAPLTEADLAPFLALSHAPEPDLFIRTGGEQRISNFLLWQIAYTELYFTDTLWPDFDAAALDEALAAFRRRERRFGRVENAGTQAASGDTARRVAR